MIARVLVQLPFSLAIPDGSSFNLRGIDRDGYTVTFRPPQRPNVSKPKEFAGTLTINEEPGFETDQLTIDFRKSDFNRSDKTESDPPMEIIGDLVNMFLVALRHLTQAREIHPLDFPHVTWSLKYLNDDESELEKAKGQFRGRGLSSFKLPATALTPQVWDAVHTLYPTFQPQRWRDLLLNAEDSIPDLGLMIVLSRTALEVFIAEALDRLAQDIPTLQAWWNWINGRGFRRNPSTEEQFSDLLQLLTGHNLQNDTYLWQSFKNLQEARNSFAHAGVAKVGGVPVTREQAIEYVKAARSITDLVSSWLPVERSEPQFTFDINLKFPAEISYPPSSGDTGA